MALLFTTVNIWRCIKFEINFNRPTTHFLDPLVPAEIYNYTIMLPWLYLYDYVMLKYKNFLSIIISYHFCCFWDQ